MFLEDSAVGREVWRESYLSLLIKLSEFFPVALQQESLRDGPLCYIAVKVREEQLCFLNQSIAFITDLLYNLCDGPENCDLRRCVCKYFSCCPMKWLL